MVPLAHGNRRLIVALEVARKAAGVVAIVVVGFAVIRLVIGSRVADLQLVAHVVRIAFVAAPAQKDAAVNIWRGGTKVGLQPEIGVVRFGGEPSVFAVDGNHSVVHLPV